LLKPSFVVAAASVASKHLIYKRLGRLENGKVTRKIHLLLASLSLIALVACTSSAGPPAPVGEIPTELSFPSSVSIDLSSIGGESSAPKSLVLLQSSGTGSLSDIISLGPVTISLADDLLETLLEPLQSLQIPVSPQVKTFQGPINIPNLAPQMLKVDFAPFDFDGDGIPEGTGCTCPVGCTGTSCPTTALLSDLKPVAYRIWIQESDGTFVRFMAGIFDILDVRDDRQTPQNEANPGKGRFRAGFVGQPISGTDQTEDLFFGVLYNHRFEADPLHKATELFVQDRRFNSVKSLVQSDDFHTQVEQEQVQPVGIPASLQKTAKLSFKELPQKEGEPFDIEYLGRFLEEFDFWSGSFVITGQQDGAPLTKSGANECARISSGAEVARNNCLDLGIDVGGEEFVAPATSADTAFPADFPASPTF